MWKYDFWSSIILGLLGAVICYASLGLGLGTWMAPGPGFMAFGAGLLLMVLSAFIGVLSILGRKGSPPEKFWPRADGPKIVLPVFLSLLAYNLLWTRLGFTLTTVLFMGFLLRAVGKRRWWVVLTGSGFTSLAAYFLFQRFLKSQLPAGILGF